MAADSQERRGEGRTGRSRDETPAAEMSGGRTGAESLARSGSLVRGSCPSANVPSTDWLPMTTTSRTSAIRETASENVCELFAGHAARPWRFARMRARSRWVSTPANGEFCRSSHPLSDRDVIASSSSSTGPSRSRAHSPNQRAATPRGCAAVRRRRFVRARRRVRSGSVTSRLATGWWSQRLRTWSLVSLPAVFSPSLSLRTSTRRTRRCVPTDEYPNRTLSQMSTTCCRDDPRIEAA